MDADDATAVRSIAIGLAILALGLFLMTRVLKFRFVVGVND